MRRVPAFSRLRVRSQVGLDIRVAASGLVAIVLALAGLLYLSSAAAPALRELGDKFFDLGIVLVLATLLLSALGIRARFH